MNIKEDLSLIKAAIESFPNEQIGITFTIPETDAQHIYPIELNAKTAPQLIEWLQETFKIEPDPSQITFGSVWNLNDIISRANDYHDYSVTPEEAKEISKIVEKNEDSNTGITWEALSEAICEYMEGKQS